VNGDAIEDLVIGAPAHNTYGPGGGKLYLLLGRSSGWRLDDTLTGMPSVAGNEGQQLSFARAVGDVNGDGLADVGVMGGGTVTGDEYLMFGTATAWPSDVLDDDADVVAHASPGNLTQEPPAGDVDGDGIDDWFLAIDFVEGGTAHVLSGARLAPSVDLPGEADAIWVHGDTSSSMLSEIEFAPLGDFTGDGLADLGASAGADSFYVVPGSALAVSGTVDDVATAWITNVKGRLSVEIFFGGTGHEGALALDDADVVLAPGWAATRVEDVGDINGDGRHDLLFQISDASAKDASDLFVVFGRASWPTSIAIDDADIRIRGTAGEEPLRVDDAMMGDLDGDGTNDLVLVSPFEDWNDIAQAGTVRVFRGRKVWPRELARNEYDVLFCGNATYQNMGGWSRLAVTDLNGDGTDDIVTSSYYHPAPDATGTTFVFFGQRAP
jgi:hypothetical protein